MAHEPILSMAAFMGGFLFDLVTLGRIDQTFSLLHQLILLLLLMGILTLEHRRQAKMLTWRPWLANLWVYHELVLQFLMGTLLSAYTIFYFKSTSDVALNFFFITLVVLLFLNEKKGLDRSRFPIRFWMMSLCISSYLIYVLPILLGRMASWVFALSMFASVLMYFGWMKWFFHRVESKKILKEPKVWAGVVVPLLLVGLYAMKWIPPVPMATLTMGIYHDVDKQNDRYILTSKAPQTWWRVWADPKVYANSGEKIYFFAGVFAPTDFEHTMHVQWLLKDINDQWQQTDQIPIHIQGGRQEGFRGYTYKEHHQPGHWRVRLVTQTGQELSRYDFQLLPENRLENQIEWQTIQY